MGASRRSQGSGPGDGGTAEPSLPVRPNDRRTPLLKAVRVIEWMADSVQPSYGVREVAQGIGMAPSTTHRLLNMLEEAGLVDTDETGRYSFSLRFVGLATRLSQVRHPLFQEALRRCRVLADETGESIYIGMYEAKTQHFMYTECIESRNPITYTMPTFRMMPLYPGAGGASILAFLPRDEQEAVLANLPLTRVTDRTLTDRRQIRKFLDATADQGFVVSVSQRIPGGAGVGAPLFGPDGSVQGNVVMALPEDRLARYHANELGRAVKAAADSSSSAAMVVEASAAS